ncbi:MAG TPA: DNA topoisomerase I, partial [Bacteroidales bacterium]|nr:DNA topoisomerase I [Bacteroidales bacterium]
ITIPGEKGLPSIQAELNKRFPELPEAEEFLKKCIGAGYKVSDIETKPARKSPAPPFTTSTLQQEASRKLGFSVSKTMMVAQQLYEAGKITYMRTDSVNLSKTAIDMAKEEITSLYGDKYLKTRKYATKSRGAQEAHEAIRPTYLNQREVGGDSAQQKLYDLIWKRTIASQMSDAELERTTVTIDVSTVKEKFVAKGEVIRFDGFLKVYLESTDDENNDTVEGMLPTLKTGQPLDLGEMLAIQKFTQQPPRYTEASLVKKMEELGIGRPSTYAPTISTIQKREYVVKEDRPGTPRPFQVIKLKGDKITKSQKTENTGQEKAKLFPTDVGSLVTSFLMQYFENIMDYNFTASVEKEFDEIAQGQKVWNQMIREFYHPFAKQVKETMEKSEKVKGERLLGKDPESGKNVYARIGRFGPMIQIGESEDEEKPKFASLKKGQSIETIELDDAMKLFDFPRSIGEYENAELTVAIGRFGPYVKHKSAFYSLAKTDDPTTVDAERAIEIIEEKRKKELEKTIKVFDEAPGVQVLNGRYGPYIAIGKNNYRIPKGTDPAALTLEQCRQIAAKADAAPKTASKGRFRKK